MNRVIVAFLVLVTPSSMAGMASAEGLGDASRRAQAKRAETKKTEPATVHTNESILPGSEESEKPSSGTFNAPPPSTNQPTATVPTASTGYRLFAGPSSGAQPASTSEGTPLSSDRGRGEGYWRGRMSAARAAVERAEKRVAQAEETERRLAFVAPTACQEGVELSSSKHETAIELRDRARRDAKPCPTPGPEKPRLTPHGELTMARRALADTEEEARRAGALPGWLR
jgi:hypothetical protein